MSGTDISYHVHSPSDLAQAASTVKTQQLLNPYPLTYSPRNHRDLESSGRDPQAEARYRSDLITSPGHVSGGGGGRGGGGGGGGGRRQEEEYRGLEREVREREREARERERELRAARQQ
eukprot:3031359-Rhodomonas_salina.3